MSVTNGQNADETTFNTAFLSRTASNTTTVATVDLLNASTTDLISIQRVINEALASLGIANQAATDASADTYSSNEIVLNGDDRKVAIGKLDAEFNNTTGHGHSGAAGDGAPISADDLSDFNNLFTEFGEYTFNSASGTSIDVTTEFSGQTSGGDANTAGVITSAPNNFCPILEQTTGGEIEDGEGDRVYARLTEAAGTWTLSFYTNEAGTETAHSLSSQDIRFLYREVFTAADRPTIGANVGVYDTLSAVGDIPDASGTQRGVVSTGSQTFAGAKDFTTRPTVNGSDVLDDDSSQVVTAKDIDGSANSASNTNRMTFAGDTNANLTALARKQGTVWYDTDSDNLVVDNGTDLVEISGGGGAGLPNYDIFGKADDAETSDFTASGLTFSISTTASELIDGASVFKAEASAASQTLTSNASSIPIPQGYRGRQLYGSFEYKTNTTDWTFTVYESDASTILFQETVPASTASGDESIKFNYSFFSPEDNDELRYEFESSASDDLIWNNNRINDLPLDFVLTNVNVNEAAYFDTLAGYGSTNTKIPYFTNQRSNDTGELIEVVYDDSTNGASVTARQECVVDMLLTVDSSGGSEAVGFSLNSSELTTDISSITAADQVNWVITNGAGVTRDVSAHIKLSPGDVLRPHTQGAAASSAARYRWHITAQGVNPSILTPGRESLTEWTAFTPSVVGAASIDNVEMYWRRVGSNVEVFGGFRPQTPNGSTAELSLPIVNGTQLTVSSKATDYNSPETELMLFGFIVVGVNSSNIRSVIADAGNSYINIGNITSGNSNIGPLTGSQVFNNNDGHSIRYSIPVAEWENEGPTFLAAIPRVRWQQKFLTSDITSNTTVSDIEFENLTIGRIYRLSAQLSAAYSSGSGDIELEFEHNSATIMRIQENEVTSNSGENVKGNSVVFTAAANTVVVNSTASASNIIQGDGTAAETYAILEELPYHSDEITNF